jgi:ATP-dependent DNA helicase RecQ
LETPLTILKQYWGHDHFRPLQEDIIQSVVNGNDTLALLPTGGGKSVCFQVPALVREGVCIVITPLIALMKDQVEQLRKKDIMAVSVHSGMTRSEIDLYLDNAVYGKIKFLYVSPERLQTEIFVERVKLMKVSLIAVDEAHCISQWGYDFRPPYLKIVSLRELKPGVPVIALTASATKNVQDDITAKLGFGKDAAVFKKSFARDNLSFVVRKSENKEKKLIEILSKVSGSAIVYVRSRKATQDIARLLMKRGISASFYHAGLSFEDRTKRQDEWINNSKRVMVATNAFGMGIDKPDVRLVIHLDLPENLEAYYQEAGRAGRDGKRAYAAVLYQQADIDNIETKVSQQFPSLAYLKQVYQALANFYQIAEGSAEGESYDFDIHQFTERFALNPVDAYHALKKLEEEGLIQLNESFYSPSTIHFLKDHHSLYQFQVANARFDEPLKMMMRLYGGELFSGFVRISEPYLAKSLNMETGQVTALLKHLHEMKIVLYAPAKDNPQLTFLLPRQDAAHLPVDVKRMQMRRDLIVGKMKAMVTYVSTDHRCRMQLVQEYFDEVSFKECEICDVCIGKRKKENRDGYALLRIEVMNVLNEKSLPIEKLEAHIAPKDQELFIDVVREMVDEGVIEYDPVWQLRISKRQ